MATASLGSHKLMAFVATRDAARARSFYRDTLGLRLLSEDRFALVFDAHGTMLRVTTVHELALAKYTVLGWEVSDIAATAKDLEPGSSSNNMASRNKTSAYLDGARWDEGCVVPRP